MVIRCRLDELMQARKLSAKRLSEMTGITEAAISEYRTNKNTRFARATLNTLCQALQCQPGDLLVYESAVPSDQTGRVDDPQAHPARP